MTRILHAILSRISTWHYERKSRREKPELWRMIDGVRAQQSRERKSLRRGDMYQQEWD
jgi:hypothetical protein